MYVVHVGLLIVVYDVTRYVLCVYLQPELGWRRSEDGRCLRGHLILNKAVGPNGKNVQLGTLSSCHGAVWPICRDIALRF